MSHQLHGNSKQEAMDNEWIFWVHLVRSHQFMKQESTFKICEDTVFDRLVDTETARHSQNS